MVSPAEHDALDLDPGTLVLDRYEVVGRLAQGGMAEVYLAKTPGPVRRDGLFVIKRVRPELASNSDFVAMFVNEARLAAQIQHPNVVRMFDCGQSAEDWVLAMEFLDGRDMLQIGRSCRALNKAVPFDVTARIVADASAGLHHAHQLTGADGKSLNLVHRDMSPENILITFDGEVKVLDFGIAKAADNALMTQAGQIKGKLGYVAPEAIKGKTLDARADIFAMGATLYLFLCGRPAFGGASPMEIFENSLKPPVPPSQINDRIPRALEEICLRCLHQEPKKRYPSAAELCAALEDYLQGTGRPLGGTQLAQFMRILFPADRDPLRQKIEGLLREAHLRAQEETNAATATASSVVVEDTADTVDADAPMPAAHMAADEASAGPPPSPEIEATTTRVQAAGIGSAEDATRPPDAASAGTEPVPAHGEGPTDDLDDLEEFPDEFEGEATIFGVDNDDDPATLPSTDAPTTLTPAVSGERYAASADISEEATRVSASAPQAEAVAPVDPAPPEPAPVTVELPVAALADPIGAPASDATLSSRPAPGGVWEPMERVDTQSRRIARPPKGRPSQVARLFAAALGALLGTTLAVGVAWQLGAWAPFARRIGVAGELPTLAPAPVPPAEGTP